MRRGCGKNGKAMAGEILKDSAMKRAREASRALFCGVLGEAPGDIREKRQLLLLRSALGKRFFVALDRVSWSGTHWTMEGSAWSRKGFCVKGEWDLCSHSVECAAEMAAGRVGRRPERSGSAEKCVALPLAE